MKSSASGSKPGTSRDMRDLVLDTVKRSTVPLKINEIGLAVGISAESPRHDDLRSVLDGLIAEGVLRRTTRRRYTLASKADKTSFVGVLVCEHPTSGVVETSDKEFPRIHIKQHDMGTALPGDTVEVQLLALRPNKKPRGEVVHILERSAAPIAGTLSADGDFLFFVPDEDFYRHDFLVSSRKSHDAKVGDKVLARFFKWDNPHKNPEAEIIEVLGRAGVVRVEFDAIVKEFRLPVAFPRAVEEAAHASANAVRNLDKRVDIRDEFVITIDPDDAKDFDDALSYTLLDNGNAELGVHIADVSTYVEEGSILDKEALNRANSYYLVDRVVPMLPEILSNNVCSLVPHQDRLTFSVFMEFTPHGKLVNYRINETIIHSKRRYTYDEVQRVIDGADDPHRDFLLSLHELATTLRHHRFQQGGIDFETSEVRWVLDENKLPIRATVKRRSDATGLVEECMLAANRTVTEHIVNVSKAWKQKRTVPFMYRIHDDPDVEKLQAAFSYVRTLGAKLPTKKATSKDINALLENLRERPEASVINQVLLRSMAKARYSGQNVGHYGLGFENYTHFTSPIRRYPDVIVHRLLKEYALAKPSDARLRALGESVEDISDHCSVQERFAVDAERASSKLAQVLMAQKHVGDVMSGVITGVTSFGVFVLMDDIYAEGLLHIRDLKGDYYTHDEQNFRLIGRRTKEVYSFGKRVQVQIARVQLEKRLIDVRLAPSEE